LTTAAYEQLVGLGICGDWLGWATLKRIDYATRRRNGSGRADALTEVTRFTFMWTAANAVFARPSLVTLFDPSIGMAPSEPVAFGAMYTASALDPLIEHDHLNTLNQILGMAQTPKRFPWLPAGTPVSVAHAIYYKYTTDREKRRGVGKKLANAISSGVYQPIDLPTLIYATRNWTLHGVLLSSSMRGTQKKFLVFIQAINDALIRVLDGAGSALLSKL
jgi:hypothetical protein